MKFSQRIGITPTHKPLQINSLDKDLKISIWNTFKVYILNKLTDDEYNKHYFNKFHDFRFMYQYHFLIEPLENMHPYKEDFDKWLLNRFESWEWHKIYDFIEFSVKIISDNRYELNTDSIEEIFNAIFEREFSAYRFINGKIAPITNEIEIDSIETSLQNTDNNSLESCNIHLKSALKFLSDKRNPDYRNSIKESISAVESIAKIITKDNSGSLKDAVAKIRKKINLHPSLENGLKQVYGYASNSNGIRHGLTEPPTCDSDDAKLILVFCSIFVNYLISKSNKAGISFDSNL